METLAPKPTIPEVLPLVKAWYAKPGNSCGGLFHTVLEEGNYERCHADRALAAAHASGDAEAVQLAQTLVAMSPTQRRKLSMLGKTGP